MKISNCNGCGRCVSICPFDALTLNGNVSVNKNCIDCGMCIGHCKYDAMSVDKEYDLDTKVKKILSWAKAYAKKHGFKVNEDNLSIINGLLKVEEKHGKRYCPCRVKKVQPNVCPCVYLEDEIKNGSCHCNFFIK